MILIALHILKILYVDGIMYYVNLLKIKLLLEEEIEGIMKSYFNNKKGNN